MSLIYAMITHGSRPYLCPISLTDRACGYGPQYERPTRSWGTLCLCSSVVERFFGKEEVVSPILTLGSHGAEIVSTGI